MKNILRKEGFQIFYDAAGKLIHEKPEVENLVSDSL